jgi:hypothetical protein
VTNYLTIPASGEAARKEHPRMDRRLLSVAISSCALLMLLGAITCLGMWTAAVSATVPPGARDIRIEQLSLTQQRLTYRLPLGWTWNDAYRHLTDQGWLVDEEVARVQHREWMDGRYRSAVLWGDSWFGLVPESLTVRRDTANQQVVAVQIFQCFRSAPWGGCL